MDIILNNSDIEEVLENVVIKDTIYTEEGRLRLNTEQIKYEIANLMPPHLTYRQLQRKTSLYLDLFDAPTQVVPTIKTLLPIIRVNKKMLEDNFKPEFHYKIDRELDPENYIFGEKFVDFMVNYSKANTDRMNPYTNTSALLYNIFRPFEAGAGAAPLQHTTDAYWHFHNTECFRVLERVEIDVGHRPETIDAEYLKEHRCPHGRRYIERPEIETLYEGDPVVIVGYRNVARPGANEELFDIRVYKEHLRSLTIGQKVSVLFNTWVYDYRNKHVEEVRGHIVKKTEHLVIELEKQVQIEDYTLHELICPFNAYVPFFVYGSEFVPRFCKKYLTTRNYTFNSADRAYIYPNSWAEYAYVTGTEPDFQNTEIDLLPHLSKLPPVSSSGPTPIYKTLHIYDKKTDFFDFSAHAADLVRYKPYRAVYDTDLSRLLYLLKQPDHGLLYIFARRSPSPRFAPDAVKERINKITLSKTAHRPAILAKSYDSIAALEADNNREIYTDKQFDKIRYHLKKTHPDKTRLLNIVDVFEADCILAGRRPVQAGDFARLGSIYYKRAIVEGDQMWVRAPKLAVCADELPTYDSLKMVLDDYDHLCKTIESAKRHREYIALHAVLDMMQTTFEDDAPLVERLRQLLLVGPAMKSPSTLYGYVDKIAHASEEFDVSTMYDFYAFGETPTIMNLPEAEEKRVLTFVDILCKTLELALIPDDLEYLHNYIEKEHDEKKFKDKLAVELKKLFAQKEAALAAARKKPADKRPELINQINKIHQNKVSTLENQEWKNFNYEKIMTSTTMLSIMIMIRYPDYLVNKLMPGCVKYFSMRGYPIVSDETIERSLTRYMACLLKSLYVVNDRRFGLLEDMDSNFKYLVLKTKKILNENYAFKKALETKVIADLPLPAHKKYDVLNVFFRPSFNFMKTHYTDPVIEYLRSIYEIVRAAKIMKYNIINMPLLNNACCLEPLFKTTDFYTMFFKVAGFETKYKAANKPDLSYSLVEYHKIKTRRRSVDLIVPNISLETYYPVKFEAPQIVLTEAKPNTWWNDECYPANLEMFEFLKSKVKVNENKLALVVEINDTTNLTRLRDIYAGFLRGSFLSLVGKLVNRFTYKVDVIRSYNELLVKINETPSCHPIMEAIARDLVGFTDNIVYDSRSQDMIVVSHNILGYTSSMLKFFVRALWRAAEVPPGESLSDLQVELMNANILHVNIVIDMIQLVLNALSEYLETNYFDANVLKKQVEVLRELRKEEEMAKYSKDDEERSLQILLRNMGVEPVLVVPEYTDYVEAPGENEDVDVDHEGYD